MAREQNRITHFVEVTLESSSGRRQARLSDLSRGGCFIDTIAQTPCGENIRFEVARDGEPLRFTGEVVYSLPGTGFGIRFTDLTEEQTAYLDEKLAGVAV